MVLMVKSLNRREFWLEYIGKWGEMNASSAIHLRSKPASEEDVVGGDD